LEHTQDNQDSIDDIVGALEEDLGAAFELQASDESAQASQPGGAADEPVAAHCPVAALPHLPPAQVAAGSSEACSSGQPAVLKPEEQAVHKDACVGTGRRRSSRLPKAASRVLPLPNSASAVIADTIPVCNSKTPQEVGAKGASVSAAVTDKDALLSTSHWQLPEGPASYEEQRWAHLLSRGWELPPAAAATKSASLAEPLRGRSLHAENTETEIAGIDPGLTSRKKKHEWKERMYGRRVDEASSWCSTHHADWKRGRSRPPATPEIPPLSHSIVLSATSIPRHESSAWAFGDLPPVDSVLPPLRYM
jgi:hypothetical protein